VDRIGNYEVLGELGRGGMGVVYEAHDPQLQRRVAVKVILDEMSEKARKRFEREASACSRLNHPNLIGVLHAGYERGRPYLVMPLVEGRTLRERLQHGPLHVKEAARLTAEIARGLEYAHRQGLVHRDVKPSNVILAQGRAVLMDFGLVHDQEGPRQRLTRTGALLGTPIYMSPEQASGRTSQIDARSDVYSLGAVLYEVLTGQPPFGEDPMAVLGRDAGSEPPPPSRLRREVDRELDAICGRCLKASPAARYPDAGSLALALEVYARGSEKAPRAKAPVVVAGAALLVGVLAAGVIVQIGAGEPAGGPSGSPTALPVAGATGPSPTAATSVSSSTPSPAASPLPSSPPAVVPDPGRVRWALATIRRHYCHTLDDIRQAARVLADASEADPDSMELLCNAAIGLQIAGDERGRTLKERAMAAGEQALGAWWILRSWGVKDRGERLAIFERALEVDPGDPRPWHTVGHCLREAGRLDDQMTLAERAMVIAPEDPILMLLYARAIKMIGQREGDAAKMREGLATCDRVLDAEPSYADAYTERGFAQWEFGTATRDTSWFASAVADLERATALRPNSAGNYWTLGVVSERIGQYEEAVRAYARSVELNPKTVLAWANMGLCKLRLGDLEGAEADLLTALEWAGPDEPNRVPIEQNLAAVREQLAERR
jgi:serine/threonine protein kinase/Flp pilus assembly protein TadD